MKETLDTYIRARTQVLGLSLSEACRQADISRQTLYALSQSDKLPSMQTVVSLANVLQVHPLRLLQIIFQDVPLARPVARQRRFDDHSAFARDVSIPDGTLVRPHECFTKTWEVQNVGQVAWENRYLQCVDEEILVYGRSGETLSLAANLQPATSRICVPFTPPGGTVQLSVNFTAPESPGTVLSYWKTVFEDGTLCFPSARGLWVKVRVCTLTTSAHEQRALRQKS